MGLQQLFNALGLTGVYGLVAVAFSLAIGVLNFLNFTIPGIFMLGAVATWFTLMRGMPLAVAGLAAVIVGALTAFLVERFIYRRLKNSDHSVPLVSSMAALLVIEGTCVNFVGADLRALPGGELSGRDFSVGGAVMSYVQLTGLLLAVGATAALAWFLHWTRHGVALRAMAESSSTTSMLGIDVVRPVVFTFVIGGAFTACSGMLFALHYQQVHPFMGEEIALKGISAMVIGGLGSVWGALLGAALVAILEVLALSYGKAELVDLVVYGALLLTLMVRPAGLLGQASIGRERV